MLLSLPLSPYFFTAVYASDMCILPVYPSFIFSKRFRAFCFHSPHSFTYLHDAVHVKGMVAPTPHRRAVIPGNVAIRTTGFECRVANATALIIDIPPPGGHAMPPMSGVEVHGNGRKWGKGRSVELDSGRHPIRCP